jgi:hypothetical protein
MDTTITRRTFSVGCGFAAAEIELLDQQPDHFRFRWKRDGGLAALSWRAEGPPAAVPRGGR